HAGNVESRDALKKLKGYASDFMDRTISDSDRPQLVGALRSQPSLPLTDKGRRRVNWRRPPNVFERQDCILTTQLQPSIFVREPTEPPSRRSRIGAQWKG